MDNGQIPVKEDHFQRMQDYFLAQEKKFIIILKANYF